MPREERKESAPSLRAERRRDPAPYLLGDDFTVADAYLFTVTRWAQFVDLDLTAFPHLQAFQQPWRRGPRWHTRWKQGLKKAA